VLSVRPEIAAIEGWSAASFPHRGHGAVDSATWALQKGQTDISDLTLLVLEDTLSCGFARFSALACRRVG
jgi:hypothetical protein